MDDVLVFGKDTNVEWNSFKDYWTTLSEATCMMINVNKFTLGRLYRLHVEFQREEV